MCVLFSGFLVTSSKQMWAVDPVITEYQEIEKGTHIQSCTQMLLQYFIYVPSDMPSIQTLNKIHIDYFSYNFLRLILH